MNDLKVDRSGFEFPRIVERSFAFLDGLGFRVVERVATLVRYARNNVEVDIYHGRRSFELGAGISIEHTRFSLSEIIRSENPTFAKDYRSSVATTDSDVCEGLEKLAALMKAYGSPALSGDQHVLLRLQQQRSQWADDYALDVLAEQLRPQAERAFRQGEYAHAVELYSQLGDRLSPAETQKLKLAKKRL